MNKCLTCGANCEKEYCFRHQKRKPLKKKYIVSTRNPKNVDDGNLMKEFFLAIWKKRLHYSEISNTFLGNEPLSTFFHHIILKSDKKYGEIGKFDPDNIILVTQEEHEQVHLDIYRYEEINKRREQLLIKYNKL